MMVPNFDGFVELPLVGTLRQCVDTPFGWQGIDDDGNVHRVTYQDGRPAKVPPFEYIMQIIDGRVTGALKIERKAS